MKKYFILWIKNLLLFVFGSFLICLTGSCKSNDEEDHVPPSPVTNLAASALDSQVLLRWTNPKDADFSHVEVKYNEEVVVTSRDSLLVESLENGVEVLFSVVAFDETGNASEARYTKATPEAARLFPADIIPNLVDWKVTLPVDDQGNDNSSVTDVNERNTNPLEIGGQDLIDYQYEPYFRAQDGEVVFRGHCAGVTTSGSKYPRCELRQLVGGGDHYWSVQDYQKLEVEVRILHTPERKPEVCFVQIHGPEDEPMRLQYHADQGLYLVWNEENKKYFKQDVPYELGQKLNVLVEVEGGEITCKVVNLANGKEFSYTWTSNDQVGYFKVGCYTQSSIFLSQIKEGYDDEPLDAYGEVAVSKIELVETF
ncbi:polysaccharide lyase family 7 protein [Thermophagus sp. OGC60D27]|uniref:polysaccharide lyase family 7 protein n=1 Tax=Thermophagus sp. OGC60D27 TaxID=3458415 RepID=UPI004037F897